MFKLLVFAIVGGLIGWLASRVMKSDKQQGALLDIGVGLAGAAVAGAAMDRGILTGDFSLMSLAAAFVGAVLLLGALNLIRKGRVR